VGPCGKKKTRIKNTPKMKIAQKIAGSGEKFQKNSWRKKV
jgi:hypothetical protein